MNRDSNSVGWGPLVQLISDENNNSKKILKDCLFIQDFDIKCQAYITFGDYAL